MLKIPTFSQNTDEIQINFRGFPEKVCITDQNCFYRPLCHHYFWHQIRFPDLQKNAFRPLDSKISWSQISMV